MKITTARLRAASIVLLTLALAVCVGDPGGNGMADPVDRPRPASVGVFVDAQNPPAGSNVDITVIVRDASGEGVPNVAVQLSPSLGDVEPPSERTNSTGIVEAVWTVGTTVGSMSVEAVVSGTDLRDSVSVTAVPGDPKALEVALADSTIQTATTQVAQLELTDRFGNPIDPLPSAPEWRSGTPSVVEVTPAGVVRALSPGVALVSAQVGAVSGQVSVEVAAAPAVAGTQLSGEVVIPDNVDPASVFLVSGAGATALSAEDGAFELTVNPEDPGIVYARSGRDLIGLSVLASVSPGELGLAVDAGVTSIDPATTAVSLVMGAEHLSQVPSRLVGDLSQIIRGTSRFSSLSSYIEGVLSQSGALPDDTDGTFVALLADVVRETYRELDAISAERGALRSPVPPERRDYVELRRPDTDRPNDGVTIQNRGGRYVAAWLEPMTLDREFAESLEDSDIFDPRLLGLPPADYGIDALSPSEWWSRLKGWDWGAKDPVALSLDFSMERPAARVIVYGLGLRELGSDWSRMLQGERRRLAYPALMTGVFNILLPILDLSGLDLTSNDIEDLSLRELFERALQNDAEAGLQCIAEAVPGEPSPDEFLACFHVILKNDAVDVVETLLDLLFDIGFEVATENLASQLVYQMKVSGAVDNLVDLEITRQTIGETSLREEFRLSHNSLRGASRILLVSGGDQVGRPGQVLPSHVVVRVTDDSDTPVPGAWVWWEVDGGGGSIPNSVSVTDEEGHASTEWTLGDAGSQRLWTRIAGESSGFTIGARAAEAPALQVAIESGPTSVRIGEQMRFEVRVRDDSGDLVEGATVTIDDEVTGGATSIASDAQGLVVYEREITSSTATGTRAVHFSASKAGFESSATVVGDVEVLAAPEPDLVVTSFTYSPSNPTAGEDVVLSYTVQNQGTAASGTWGWELSGTVSAGDTESSLAPGASFSNTYRIGTAPEGGYLINFTADPAELIDESNEGNNSRNVSFDVDAPPTTGSLKVNTYTVGTNRDSDGYQLLMNGVFVSNLDPRDGKWFYDLTAGDYILSLGGVASNCNVDGGTNKIVTVVAGDGVELDYIIRCN